MCSKTLHSTLCFIKDAVVTKMIFEEGSVAGSTSTYSSVIDVYPDVKYTIAVHVLQNGLEDTDANVKIIVEGNSIGECSPTGNNNDCSFYDCSSQVSSRIYSSPSGKISVELQYVGNSAAYCSCDITSWACSSDIARTPVVMAANIELKPWGRII